MLPPGVGNVERNLLQREEQETIASEIRELSHAAIPQHLEALPAGAKSRRRGSIQADCQLIKAEIHKSRCGSASPHQGDPLRVATPQLPPKRASRGRGFTKEPLPADTGRGGSPDPCPSGPSAASPPGGALSESPNKPMSASGSAVRSETAFWRIRSPSASGSPTLWRSLLTPSRKGSGCWLRGWADTIIGLGRKKKIR